MLSPQENTMRKGKKYVIEEEFTDGCQLPAKYREYAEGKGFTEDRIKLEFEHFFIRFSGSGTKRPGWYKSWQMWCLNSVKWDGNKSGNRNGAGGEPTSISNITADLIAECSSL
jgi:hypothetical protein